MTGTIKSPKNYLPPIEFIAIFLVAIALRIFALNFTFIVNLDGPMYIQQAKLIDLGRFRELTSCGFKFVSLYPILIAIAHTVIDDWVFAARSVSFFFGTATLFPIYYLFRRFFDAGISAMALLFFSVIPVFVGHSVDLIRGPIAWFFLSSGIYFFIRQTEEERKLLLLLASLSFIIGAWARIEMLLGWSIGFLCLVFWKDQKKYRKLLLFLSPLIIIFLVLVSLAFIKGISASHFHRTDEIFKLLTMPFIRYSQLQAGLEALASEKTVFFIKLFLPEAGNLIWLIAAGTLCIVLLEAIFYPICLLYLLGLQGVWHKIKADRRVTYLALLSLSGCMLLYLHTLQKWQLENRFTTIVIIPSAVLIGFGLEKIRTFLSTRYSLKVRWSYFILILFLMVSTLPKNIQFRDADKRIYKEIGLYIAQQKTEKKEIRITTDLALQRWASFYANLYMPGAPCPQHFDYCYERLPDTYDSFLSELKQKDIDYWVYSERSWPKGKFDIRAVDYDNLRPIKTWEDPECGSFILFKVI